MTNNTPEYEMDEDEYQAWLDEVDKKEMEEAQENWEQYCQEMDSDSEDKNKPTT
jgi:N-dimethylarginine dimethylaminohydrolase